MSNNINVCSGIISRIFVHTDDVITFARFTLIGNKTIYELTTRDFDIRKNLELTKTGDKVSFESEITGFILKENKFRKFNNITLDNEVDN